VYGRATGTRIVLAHVKVVRELTKSGGRRASVSEKTVVWDLSIARKNYVRIGLVIGLADQ
jgi:hypothetical protein